MRNLFVTGLATLLMLWQSSSISNGQAGLPLVPEASDKTVIRVLEQKSAVNTDSINQTTKRIEQKVDLLKKEKKVPVKTRYIRIKPKPDTVYLPFPEDSIREIIEQQLALLKRDTVYLPAPAALPVAKKRSLWYRIF